MFILFSIFITKKNIIRKNDEVEVGVKILEICKTCFNNLKLLDQSPDMFYYETVNTNFLHILSTLHLPALCITT